MSLIEAYKFALHTGDRLARQQALRKWELQMTEQSNPPTSRNPLETGPISINPEDTSQQQSTDSIAPPATSVVDNLSTTPPQNPSTATPKDAIATLRGRINEPEVSVSLDPQADALTAFRQGYEIALTHVEEALGITRG